MPTASLLPLDVFSSHHLQHRMKGLLPASVVAPGAPAVEAVYGCQLVGGGIMALAALASQAELRYQRQHLTGVTHDDINVAMLLDGAATMAADGVAFDLAPGDVWFVAAARPTTFHVASACRLLALRLPFSRFCSGQGGKFSDFRPAAAHGDTPLRRAAWQHVEQVLPALTISSMQTVLHAEQAFISLLAAIYADVQQDHAARVPSRHEQLDAVIDALAGDASLAVADVAAALGISIRRVHSLFAERGERFGDVLLARRLALAYEALRLPAHAETGVAQIGYRAGFNSASHFSRCFKQRYGVSPSDFRACAQRLSVLHPGATLPA